jgi:micrococcal nuclease
MSKLTPSSPTAQSRRQNRGFGAATGLSGTAILAVLLGVTALTGCTAPTLGSNHSTAPPGIPPGAERLTVDHVHDGDTLWAIDATGEPVKIRLIGVDTPEVSDPIECYAGQARDRLTELAPKKSMLWAIEDQEPVDRYGRALLYLWTEDGTFINLELVADGFGVALRVRPNDHFYPELKAAESSAKAEERGLWGACSR